jgi:hypothetical protein
MRPDYQPEMESCSTNVGVVPIYDTVVLGTCPITRRNIKGRPFWSRVLSVRLEPLQKGTPFYD